METEHKLFFKDARQMEEVPSRSVDLVVTSPPYPMIKMWDDIFAKQNNEISEALEKDDGKRAFQLMHEILDPVWDEAFRVLEEGGFVCINIGDATRTIGDNFNLFPNHSRILEYLGKIGFTILPDIIWRKQTNAPNKFMGSGMLPAGAYVTLEHEYILVARKGSKRIFKTAAEKRQRQESALFWEERNTFFSDIWFDIKGTRQDFPVSLSRKRSGAFPFDLAYRLINMYSVKNDMILDPFCGTGTAMAAAMAGARNSIGFEIDKRLLESINIVKDSIVDFSSRLIKSRLDNHLEFVREREKTNKEFKYINEHYGFPVVTNQERMIMFNKLRNIKKRDENSFIVNYSDLF